MRLSCVTCADEPDPGQVAWATVHSSEREFEHERFAVWPCPRCRCIHACGDVDLDRHYRRYGLHETGLDLLERVCCRNKLRFIRRFVPLDRGGRCWTSAAATASSSSTSAGRLPLPPDPDAHHIDLERAATVRQVLQQPYPRHLVTTAWPGPTAPPSIPGSRSSTCRRSTGTWTGTAGWSPSNEPFRWSSLLQPGFWYRGLAGGLVSRTDEVQLIFRRAG